MTAAGKTPAVGSRNKGSAAKPGTASAVPENGVGTTGGATDDGAQGGNAGNAGDLAGDVGVLGQEQVPVPAFPRLVAIVNDTPIPYVVAGKYVVGHETKHVAVNDEDEITRMKSDCEQIMSLNDPHQSTEVPALRVTEVE